MRINIQSRQTGKSWDIASKMKKIKNSICIQPTCSASDLFCSRYGFTKKRVFTLDEIIKLKIANRTIFIDEVGCCLDVFLREKGLIDHGTHTN